MPQNLVQRWLAMDLSWVCCEGAVALVVHTKGNCGSLLVVPNPTTDSTTVVVFPIFAHVLLPILKTLRMSTPHAASESLAQVFPTQLQILKVWLNFCPACSRCSFKASQKVFAQSCPPSQGLGLVAPAGFSVCRTLEMMGSLDGAPKFRNGLFPTGDDPVSHREYFSQQPAAQQI